MSYPSDDDGDARIGVLPASGCERFEIVQDLAGIQRRQQPVRLSPNPSTPDGLS